LAVLPRLALSYRGSEYAKHPRDRSGKESSKSSAFDRGMKTVEPPPRVLIFPPGRYNSMFFPKIIS
jgi:hypothetical protein